MGKKLNRKIKISMGISCLYCFVLVGTTLNCWLTTFLFDVRCIKDLPRRAYQVVSHPLWFTDHLGETTTKSSSAPPTYSFHIHEMSYMSSMGLWTYHKTAHINGLCKEEGASENVLSIRLFLSGSSPLNTVSSFVLLLDSAPTPSA